MLLRSSNRLPLELPDLFTPLPTEDQWTDNLCLVVAMSQGKFALAFFDFYFLLFEFVFITRKNRRESVAFEKIQR